MTIIKKKDIKSFNALTEKKSGLDELVDSDGSPIGGDMNIVNDTEISSEKTTDAVVSATRGGGLKRGYGGLYGGISTGIRENMDDIDNNNVPDMEDMSNKFSKPITAGKTQELIDSIRKNNLNGEELGMILNHLIVNVNIQSIPQSYKDKIKSNL